MAAASTTTGSGSFLKRHRTAAVARNSATVGRFTMGSLAQHHHGSSDSAHGSGGNAIHERDHAGCLPCFLEVRRRDRGEQVAGQKSRRRCDNRAPEAAGQEADEPGGDNDRAWGDHGHGHGIHKLAIRQPRILLDHAAIKERHDGQATAEDEGAPHR